MKGTAKHRRRQFADRRRKVTAHANVHSIWPRVQYDILSPSDFRAAEEVRTKMFKYFVASRAKENASAFGIESPVHSSPTGLAFASVNVDLSSRVLRPNRLTSSTRNISHSHRYEIEMKAKSEQQKSSIDTDFKRIETNGNGKFLAERERAANTDSI